jgi:hypothetical protein
VEAAERVPKAVVKAWASFADNRRCIPHPCTASAREVISMKARLILGLVVFNALGLVALVLLCGLPALTG